MMRGAGMGDAAPVDTRAADLFRELEPRLRQGLLAYGGPADLDDAIGETFLYLCANAELVLSMGNPKGYLYKVARDRVRGSRRKPIELPALPHAELPAVEPALLDALRALPRTQRVAVFLVTGLNWRWVEAADFLGVSVSTVRNHHRRGLATLTKKLGKGTHD